MADPVDDWAPVAAAKPQDDWQPVGAPAAAPTMPPLTGADEGPQPVPQAFLDRVARGSAIQRIMEKAAAGAKEGLGDEPVTGLSDESIQQGINLGIFHDPLKGGPTPIQLMNESAIMPTAKAFETLMRGANAGLYGAAAAFGQINEELGASQGTANRAKNEVINAGNWAMAEGGMGRFSRPATAPGAVTEQPIGTLPTPADFKNAATVLGGPDAEANLRQAWQEHGIHPAEAVHDAQSDAFLKHELTAPQVKIVAQPSELGIPKQVRAGPFSIETTPISGKSLWHETSGENASQIIQDDLTTSVDRARTSNIFVADNPDIAIGQGGSGVRIEFDGDYVSAQEHKKPGTGDLTGREYQTNAIGNNAIKSVEVAPGAKINLSPAWKARFEHEFKPTELEDGATRWTRQPGEPKELVLDPVAEEALTATGGRPGALGAAATEAPTDVPLSVQPTPQPGRVAAAAQSAADTLFDIGRDIQMKVAPMATGTTETMAVAKDFANSMRRNRWEWTRVDDDIATRFNPEQRERMWNAADEESVARQLGESREHQGLVTLEPAERAAVEDLHARAQNAWVRAYDAGLVEGEGLPAYTPRMVINTASAVAEDRALPLNSIGNNLKTTSSNLRERKYMTAEETEAAARAKFGEQAGIARDIRALPLATAKLEDAIAGRTLINHIKNIGKATGDETIAEGAIPAGSEHTWFTLDHPAFRTWKPRFERGADGEIKLDGNKVSVAKDADGHDIFDQVPIYVRGDFEGPLRAVLSTKSGPLYKAIMDIKGKTTSMIMLSPMIHNMVEFGRAFPAMPTRIVKAYFDGNRAKNDVAVMREAIDGGLVPIGKRFFKQDIDSIMEAPDLTPGRSWTSQVLAAVPGLFDEAAGTAVKRAIDKAGDFWHNTLLWDRIADLQMGLYTNMQGDMIAKGVDRQTATRVAAHMANRYAGSLPQEAMSSAARKTANFLMFSRTFTMGNLGVMKDMFTGMPKDVLAQIERDMGTVNPEAVGYAKSMARRKAIATVALDVGLKYVGTSVLASTLAVMIGDSTIGEEGQRYVKRLRDVLNRVETHPASLLQPFDLMERLSSTADNEPGLKDYAKAGYMKDGTAIYARNPLGKIGDEFIGYGTGPLDMMKRKEGTIARPLLQVFSNDKGFGRKIYDPDADTPAKYAANIWEIVKHIAKSQFPEGQIGAGWDLVRGEGDAKLNAMQTFGPFLGATFRKGAPGGPAVGEMYHARDQHQFAVDQAMPDIRKQIQRGDTAGAYQRMNALGIPAGLQRFYVRTTINPATRLSPRALRDFYNYASPEARARMENLRQPGPLTPQE